MIVAFSRDTGLVMTSKLKLACARESGDISAAGLQLNSFLPDINMTIGSVLNARPICLSFFCLLPINSLWMAAALPILSCGIARGRQEKNGVLTLAVLRYHAMCMLNLESSAKSQISCFNAQRHPLVPHIAIPF